MPFETAVLNFHHHWAYATIGGTLRELKTLKPSLHGLMTEEHSMTDKSIETTSDETGEFVIYTTEDGRTEVHLRVWEDSVWMTQAQIAELFGVSRANISAHIKNIYADNELSRDRTIKSYLIVRSEGD
jgi:hypothetical protein